MRQKIGIGNDTARGIVIRGINHFTECLVVMYPKDFPDEDCTCWDDSPEWCG